MRFFMFFGSLTLSIIILYSALSDVQAGTQEGDTLQTQALDASYGNAQPLSDEDAIHSIIEKQLRAFRERKSHDAYTLNSQNFKDDYRDENHFMTMMRITHKALLEHVSYSFLESSQVNDILIQKIELIAKDGSAITAMVYINKDDETQAWSVDGYTILDAKDAQPI